MHATNHVRLAPDDRLGNYRVERELGSTPTGVRYAAVHVVLPRRAVVKVTTLPALAKHLLREACILEALRHPGAPQVYESGLLPDRRPWFAVEETSGITLAARIAQHPLGAFDATVLVRDIANVLEHAHRRGVVHGDLRPDGIVLTAQRRFGICIPDWSAARTHDAAPVMPDLPTDTQPYLAPEQLRGDPIDDRADVFALGVIAYVALTGGHPFASLDAAHAARRTAREAAPHAPAELARMIDQMLALDRSDRPAAAEVRSDLDWLASALASDGAPVAPIEDIILVDTEGMPALPRIRKPRWTPAYVPATDDYAEIEIAPTKPAD